MIFFSKRSPTNQQLPNKEACLSILGLILAIGLIGGAGGLIYGIITNSSSAIISGAIVFGISLIVTIMFILLMMFCFKKNNVESNTNQQRRHPNRNRQTNHEHSSHEIPTVSNMHRYEHTNDFSMQMHSPHIHTGLADSANYGYGRQVSQSPPKPSHWTILNQSNSSKNSNNLRPNNYN